MNMQYKYHIRRTSFLIVLVLLFCLTGLPTITGAVSDWQPVETMPWVQVDIPPGWTIPDDIRTEDDNSTVSFTARSPDWNSELVYILEHTGKEMDMDRMQEYQDNWMANNGYRICQTKDPVMRKKTDHSSLKQVYVQGSDKGAVMYSATYPAWGRYHVALLMTGESAVDQYYDSVPEQIPDHIIPVKESKEKIGTISFTPASQ